MYYVTIDCGTTNSRAYVVDHSGKILGKASKMVGVRVYMKLLPKQSKTRMLRRTKFKLCCHLG